MRSMYLKTFLVVMVILGVSLPSMAAVMGGTEGLYDSLTNLGAYAGGLTFFFDDRDIEFISTSAGDLKVTGRSGGLQGGVWQAGVPEPSSMAIFAVGALGMAYRAGRKRHLA